MAEVHEITRSAFDTIVWNGARVPTGSYAVVYKYYYAGRRFDFNNRRSEANFACCINWYDVDRDAVYSANASEEYELARTAYIKDYECVACYEVWHVLDDADDDDWEDALDELLLSGSGSDWRSRCGAVDKLENEAETLESLRQLREAGALDGDVPLHDDLSACVYEGGKPKNWHLLIKFDGDDNEYRLSSADDARDFITTIESIYQLEETSLTV